MHLSVFHNFVRHLLCFIWTLKLCFSTNCFNIMSDLAFQQVPWKKNCQREISNQRWITANALCELQLCISIWKKVWILACLHLLMVCNVLRKTADISYNIKIGTSLTFGVVLGGKSSLHCLQLYRYMYFKKQFIIKVKTWMSIVVCGL